MPTPRYAYMTNAELLRAARGPEVDSLDREGLMDLVVELTAALEDAHDTRDNSFHSNSRRQNRAGPNHIRPINLKENTCSN